MSRAAFRFAAAPSALPQRAPADAELFGEVALGGQASVRAEAVPTTQSALASTIERRPAAASITERRFRVRRLRRAGARASRDGWSRLRPSSVLLQYATSRRDHYTNRTTICNRCDF